MNIFMAHTPIPDVKLNNAENMRRLTLTNTLEYYDVPQILTAADATGTRYLCTLYEQTADGYHYLGVQISEPRLMLSSADNLTCAMPTSILKWIMPSMSWR